MERHTGAAPRATEPAPTGPVPTTAKIRILAPEAIPVAEATSVPAETGRAIDAEVRLRTPAADPGRHHPGPADARVVDVHVRRAAIRWLVGVRVSIGHPYPPVLPRVDPLSGRGSVVLGDSLLGRRRRIVGWRGRRHAGLRNSGLNDGRAGRPIIGRGRQRRTQQQQHRKQALHRATAFDHSRQPEAPFEPSSPAS